MQRITTLRNGCKINLYLRVGERLPNGYHELDTLFLPVAEPHDTITIERLDAASGSQLPGGITVAFNKKIHPQHNTLTKAYDWYAKATGFAPALRVSVTKGIPHGAGLGGGSANAAMLLRYLQSENEKDGGTPLPHADLVVQSAAIGADVPFFLLGEPALATGVGEKLVPTANPCAGWFLVLVCPEASVSTGWAFAALDALREKNKKNGAKNLTLKRGQAISSLARGVQLGNDFEEVVFESLPELVEIRKKLLANSAEAVHISGTGSSLFGLFKDEDCARKAVKTLALTKSSVYIQQM